MRWIHGIIELVMAALALVIGLRFVRHARALPTYFNILVAFAFLSSALVAIPHGVIPLLSEHDNFSSLMGTTARYLMLVSLGMAGLFQRYCWTLRVTKILVAAVVVALIAGAGGIFWVSTAGLLPVGFSPLVIGFGWLGLIALFNHTPGSAVQMPSGFKWFMLFAAAGYFTLAIAPGGSYSTGGIVAHTLWLLEYAAYFFMLWWDKSHYKTYSDSVFTKLRAIQSNEAFSESHKRVGELEAYLNNLRQTRGP